MPEFQMLGISAKLKLAEPQQGQITAEPASHVQSHIYPHRICYGDVNCPRQWLVIFIIRFLRFHFAGLPSWYANSFLPLVKAPHKLFIMPAYANEEVVTSTSGQNSWGNKRKAGKPRKTALGINRTSLFLIAFLDTAKVYSTVRFLLGKYIKNN